MKRLNKVSSIVCVLLLAAICLPQNATAQRFSHGGGAGGGMRGGGGGMRGGGGFHPSGATMRPAPSGGGARPMPAARTINGGGVNIGNHAFRPAEGNGGRPAFGGFRNGSGFRNENAFHHSGFGMHPYSYHPYHPYIWGPRWHPFGFFLGALTADAIMFSWGSQNYYYDDGVYYQPSNSGYVAVAPPIGATVSYLPQGYETLPGDNATYFYYAGVFYISENNGYRVVPAPAGAIVTEIPQGATEQNINGQTYLLYNNTYYLPISQNGQDAYQVAEVN